MIRNDVRTTRGGDQDECRINDEINVSLVRLVDEKGQNRGEISIAEALSLADEAGMDLVEVAPQSKPPVCKIIDYSKFRYNQQKKRQEQRRKNKTLEMKEIKLRPNIDSRDYEIKSKHIKKFLTGGHRVKVSLRFRGREFAHQELGMELLQKLMVEFAENAKVESKPSMEGRQLVMMLVPK